MKCGEFVRFPFLCGVIVLGVLFYRVFDVIYIGLSPPAPLDLPLNIAMLKQPQHFRSLLGMYEEWVHHLERCGDISIDPSLHVAQGGTTRPPMMDILVRFIGSEL